MLLHEIRVVKTNYFKHLLLSKFFRSYNVKSIKISGSAVAFTALLLVIRLLFAFDTTLLLDASLFPFGYPISWFFLFCSDIAAIDCRRTDLRIGVAVGMYIVFRRC